LRRIRRSPDGGTNRPTFVGEQHEAGRHSPDAARAISFAERNGFEGDVCVFELPPAAPPIVIESVTGRALTLAPGDRFLGTAGYRESTRWVVGSIPEGGLVPGNDYWVLADCGVVGELLGDSPREKGHLGQVRFLGIMRKEALEYPGVCAIPWCASASITTRRCSLLGASSEWERQPPRSAFCAPWQNRRMYRGLKATGVIRHRTAAMGIWCCAVFGLVDFGLPTTYPSGRDGSDHFDTCSTCASGYRRCGPD
jgi:hypothetical protein